jgi:hypothetical protein
VLPQAAARARLHGDAALRERAERVFEALPGLPSNALTRLMAAQLGLARLPARALEHAGLQQLWAVHCREKACERCPCGQLAAGVGDGGGMGGKVARRAGGCAY